MYRYNHIKEKLKDGDLLLTEVNSHPSRRMVTVKGDGVLLENEWFHWDFFFEVNHPIEPEFYLSFCDKCYQMTNHLDGKCQKCKKV